MPYVEQRGRFTPHWRGMAQGGTGFPRFHPGIGIIVETFPLHEITSTSSIAPFSQQLLNLPYIFVYADCGGHIGSQLIDVE